MALIDELLDNNHRCKEPTSADFCDGPDAEGCWVEFGDDNLHYEQIAGNSGIYLVATNLLTDEVVRDDRPWQMTV